MQIKKCALDTKDICSIIVSSCDGFRDVWHPFFTLFFRYWSDCPFRIYLTANRCSYDDIRIQTIRAGRDRGWATNMRRALEQIATPLVLYLQEDYFLTRQADTARIIALAEHALQEGAACVRIYPCPGPDEDLDEARGLGRISQHAEYRVSLQAAIWNREILQALITDGESGWDMEMKGTKRAADIDKPFFSVTRRYLSDGTLDAPLPYLCSAVERGCWVPEALDLCRREGIEVDTGRRPLKGDVPATARCGRLRGLLKKIKNITF